MKTIEFNPYLKSSVELAFNCQKCGNKLVGEYYIELDKSSKLMNGVGCQVCNETYLIDLYRTLLGKGYCEIEKLTECYPVHYNVFHYIGIQEYPDPILRVTYFKEIYDGSIYKIQKLNEIDLSNITLNNYQKNLLYSSVITSLEVYLSDAFIYLLQYKDEYWSNYAKDKLESKTTLLEDLGYRSFHNPEFTKKQFQKSFKIVFPDIEPIKPFVDKRHDIVHRNGKKKGSNSNYWETTEAEIKETILTVNQFIQEVENIIIDL